MGQLKQPELTADEFLVWAMEQPTGRYELDNGVVVAMAPERVSHARAKFNAAIALRAAVLARGLGCEVFPDGPSVRINERTVFEPDALVRCGPAVASDAIEIGDPVAVVEVVSPSSRGIDRGVKLVGYFSLPSVRHYLIVDTEKRTVIHHRRSEDGALAALIVPEGAITLDPPGLVIDVAEIFAGFGAA